MLRSFLIYGLLLAGSIPVYAQSNKGKTTEKKPLRFKTSWGIFLSDTLPRPEVVKLLDSALVVRDQQNNKFPVISFDLTYEQKEPYVNDTTGRAGVYTEYIGDTFKSDRLSPLWSSRLKEMLQKGDVLYFGNIIVKYPGDKYYRVPELKIVIR
jgi:hypothetical protein